MANRQCECVGPNSGSSQPHDNVVLVSGVDVGAIHSWLPLQDDLYQYRSGRADNGIASDSVRDPQPTVSKPVIVSDVFAQLLQQIVENWER